MEILSKLFGSAGIVKILRLFLFNPTEPYEPKDVVKRTRTDTDVVRSELSMLANVGFLRRRSFYKDIEEPITRRVSVSRKRKKTKLKRKRVMGWILNQEFSYLKPLQDLLMSTTSLETDNVTRRLCKAGNLKLVIIAGVFVQHWDSRLDILIVGDKVKQSQLSHVIKDIESELGREIRYAVFSTQDFKYRLGIYDRLVRDVLDYPHKTVVDRLGLTLSLG
ncbi:MAG TPA: hypothetical protein VJH21_02090 [Candidatus Paceibacterota bacterium]